MTTTDLLDLALKPEHSVRVSRSRAGWWVAKCSCGWTGELRKQERWARFDADKHERNWS